MPEERIYLELSDEVESANKFYEVILDDAHLTIRFGRIGTAGQVQVKNYAAANQAATEGQRMIGEKLRKGYMSVSSGGGVTVNALTPVDRAAGRLVASPAIEIPCSVVTRSG